MINNAIVNDNIMSFGKEKDDFLTDENIKDILLSGTSSVQKYIKFKKNIKNRKYLKIYYKNQFWAFK